MAEHTPGEWQARQPHSILNTPHSLWEIWSAQTDGRSLFVADLASKADARLIAAAPDLLAALEAFLGGTLYNDPLPLYLAARAAIAKARVQRDHRV